MLCWQLVIFKIVSYSQRRFYIAIRPGRPRPWPTQTRSWPTQTARVIPMIPTYTTSAGLPKICLAFDWPTQMKIPRTAPGYSASCGLDAYYFSFDWMPLVKTIFSEFQYIIHASVMKLNTFYFLSSSVHRTHTTHFYKKKLTVASCNWSQSQNYTYTTPWFKNAALSIWL